MSLQNQDCPGRPLKEDVLVAMVPHIAYEVDTLANLAAPKDWSLIDHAGVTVEWAKGGVLDYLDRAIAESIFVHLRSLTEFLVSPPASGFPQCLGIRADDYFIDGPWKHRDSHVLGGPLPVKISNDQRKARKRTHEFEFEALSRRVVHISTSRPHYPQEVDDWRRFLDHVPDVLMAFALFLHDLPSARRQWFSEAHKVNLPEFPDVTPYRPG